MWSARSLRTVLPVSTRAVSSSTWRSIATPKVGNATVINEVSAETSRNALYSTSTFASSESKRRKSRSAVSQTELNDHFRASGPGHVLGIDTGLSSEVANDVASRLTKVHARNLVPLLSANSAGRSFPIQAVHLAERIERPLSPLGFVPGMDSTQVRHLHSKRSSLPPADRSSDSAGKVVDYFDTSMLSSEVWTIPNAITLFRIAATPLLAHQVAIGNYQIACAGFVLAGVSDWLDGFIAKRYNMQSILGSFLDPLADKVLVGCMSIAMATSGVMAAPLAVVFVGRDLSLVAGTVAMRMKLMKKPYSWKGFFNVSDVKTFSIKPFLIGKLNTVGQISLIGATLATAAFDLPFTQELSTMGWAVGATTIMSGLSYLWAFMKGSSALAKMKK